MQKLNVGDTVNVDSYEGFGGIARIIGTRPSETGRYRVLMLDGSQSEFWAHDFEICELRQNPIEKIDSRIQTYEHIQTVQRLLGEAIRDLQERQRVHDQSKLKSPEVEAFDEWTPKLNASAYGTPEYAAMLAAMKPALDHHYAHNSHHPEYYADGIRGMSLLDLIEMICDWQAATLRHNDGDIQRSIELNQKRFGYSDELKQIFKNTVMRKSATVPAV